MVEVKKGRDTVSISVYVYSPSSVNALYIALFPPQIISPAPLL